MYTSIVVPLDGSAFGNSALPVALALALRSDAFVHLVHVHQPIVFAEGGPMYDTRLYGDLRQEMRTDLATVAERLKRETSLRVDIEFLDGPVVPTLQRYLADRRPDLVVMMTHGCGGLSRLWLGSVAEGLVRTASVPLLFVRLETEWHSEPAAPPFRHILVPLDGSAMADEVLNHVVSLGTPGVTVYVLLTILVPLSKRTGAEFEAAGDSSDADHQRIVALEYLTTVANELRESGAIVEIQIEAHQQAAHGILDAASRQHADLIALSTHGRGGVSRLLHGGVADKVLRGATVPIILYPPERVRAESTEWIREHSPARVTRAGSSNAA